MKAAPIIVFAFNRPSHLKKSLEQLSISSMAQQSDLIIFCDGPRSPSESILTDQVREVAHDAKNFASLKVVGRERNIGLGRSIIFGVSEVLSYYESALVFEDDLLCAPPTVPFLNDCLNYYRNDPNVFSATAFNFFHHDLALPNTYDKDVVFSHRPSSCAWATWADRWFKVDWEVKDYEDFKNNPSRIRDFNRGGGDLARMLKLQMSGRINSWAIRWAYHHYKYRGLCVYPRYSMVGNSGFDGSGTHSFGNPGRHYRVDFSLVKNQYILCPSNGMATPIFEECLRRLYRRTPLYYIRRVIEVAVFKLIKFIERERK